MVVNFPFHNTKYKITGKIKQPIRWFFPTPNEEVTKPIAVAVNKMIRPIKPSKYKANKVIKMMIPNSNLV